ncbi:fibronectin type III domain-containing protein [Planctomycetota bacterium]
MTRPVKSPSLGQVALAVAAAAMLLFGASPQLLAAEPIPAPVAEIHDATIVPPETRIRPNGKIVIPVLPAERHLQGQVLLRFEAIIPFAKEAGYTSSARITVNGRTLDDSHFPLNWTDQRTWSIPAVRPKPLPLYTPGSKTWTVRYDNDRWPPAEESFYYSPEMAGRYVYMFPLGGLLKAGENHIEIENTSEKYPLQLFNCELGIYGNDEPRVSNFRCRHATDTTISLSWYSTRSRFEIDYRPRGTAEWQTVLHVHSWENPYTLIMLQPATSYECRVRGLPQPVANLQGEVVPFGPIESSVLEVQTKSEAAIDEFAGFRLHSTRRVPGGLATYPCIESHNGLLWLVDGSLHLVKLDPDDGGLVSTSEQPLSAWPMPPPRGYMGIPDTTVFDDRLWITYNCQATRNPEGYQITQSRQFLLSYDFATGQVSSPIVVEPLSPEHGSWEGGVEAWRGQLWVMQMDVWKEADVRRTRIVLRTFVDGKFGEPVVYDDCPTVYPYGPSISVYDDKLLLLFSDLAAAEDDPNHEPLLYTLFDGKKFTQARTLQNTGRNRYAKGGQVGDRFLCAYKSSAPYYEDYGYQYHDIALSVFTPGDDDVQTTMYVADRKYNSSPDVALHAGRIFVVYNKFEHLYGQRDNPAIRYGDFIGRLVPVEPVPR